jgi:hypothetical protein
MAYALQFKPAALRQLEKPPHTVGGDPVGIPTAAAPSSELVRQSLGPTVFPANHMRPHFSDVATVACDYDCLLDDRLTN